jgi:hypothetical protein
MKSASRPDSWVGEHQKTNGISSKPHLTREEVAAALVHIPPFLPSRGLIDTSDAFKVIV